MKANEENINIIYSKMVKDGWHVTLPLKWGFFFIGNAKGSLQEVFTELVEHNYQCEHIQQNENNEWVLRVTKIETVPSDKLHRRNLAFNELAAAYDCCYDGWDVEKS